MDGVLEGTSVGLIAGKSVGVTVVSMDGEHVGPRFGLSVCVWVGVLMRSTLGV